MSRFEFNLCGLFALFYLCSLNANRPGGSNWGKAVSQTSSAQVKVAAVVKTTVKTDSKPAPKKRRKIHPSGFTGKGKRSAFQILVRLPGQVSHSGMLYCFPVHSDCDAIINVYCCSSQCTTRWQC